MRLPLLGAGALLLLLSCSCARRPSLSSADLKSVYARHRWDRIQSVIDSAPHSPEAYEAYELLSHFYLRTGQYHRFISIMRERWSAFPGKREQQDERKAVQGFDGLPDQTVETNTRSSSVTHDPGDIFIPLSINGVAANYFFDTGAWVSCMSESEARRIGLDINAGAGTLGTTTSATAFRTAIADNVVIGNIHYRNVSFAIFQDAQEPWSDLEPSRRGIVGIPLILGFRTFRWIRNGAMEIGGTTSSFDPVKANLHYSDDHLTVDAQVRQERFLATLDTGAETTDLFAAFGARFLPALGRSGKKTTEDLRGVGGAEKHEAVELPPLTIAVGGQETILNPARILVDKTWDKCCLANIGMDLLKQADAFRIDFDAMTLELQRPESSGDRR